MLFIVYSIYCVECWPETIQENLCKRKRHISQSRQFNEKITWVSLIKSTLRTPSYKIKVNKEITIFLF